MITITIETDNSVFQDDPRFEVGRILKELADKIADRGLENSPIMDCYGNRVGDLTNE